MMFKRKREKIRQNILHNLTLCRLNGDLLAVEAAIRDNAPKVVEPEAEGNRFKKFVAGIVNELGNKARAANVRELSVDKEAAEDAIKSFRASHSEYDLSLGEDTDKFKEYITKKLFKKDPNGLGRLSFGIMFALDERNQVYQCPEESLEVVSEILFDDPKKLGSLYTSYKNNFAKIQRSTLSDADGAMRICNGFGGTVLVAVMPLCITGAIAVMGHIVDKRNVRAAFTNLCMTDMNAFLAFRLTLIEATRDLDEEKRKEIIDAFLGEISRIRSDAEYKMCVEKINIPECRETIETCDLALNRLTKIIGV